MIIFILFILISYLIYDTGVAVFKRKTYSPVIAVCIATNEAWIHTEDSSSYGKKGTFRYTYNGNIYEQSEIGYPSTRKLKVNQKRIIYVNPKNPNEFISKDNITRILIVDILFVFILLIAVLIV